MKTWITEVATIGTIAAGLDTAQQLLTANPIIPPPWGAVVLGGLSFLTLVLRTVQKQKEKKA